LTSKLRRRKKEETAEGGATSGAEVDVAGPDREATEAVEPRRLKTCER
jgi:hypothetical protein